MSPPSPVSAPPTEVENIIPWWVFLNSFCRFTSSFNFTMSPQFSVYQGDCIISRLSTLCLRLRESLYETLINLFSGAWVQVQQGKHTVTFMLFMCRGGIFITSRFISPSLTACRYSHIKSMCQFGIYVVPGSIIGQDCCINSDRDRSARSLRIPFNRVPGSNWLLFM